MKILSYSFRTNPYLEDLNVIFPNLFVFKKLNFDLKIFSNQIFRHKPDIILGVAKSSLPHSQFEYLTINQFHKYKKVDRDGPLEYKLYLPSIKQTIFKVSKKPTDSFCNWTMYKISHFIHENQIPSKLTFVHLLKKDLKNLALLFPNSN